MPMVKRYVAGSSPAMGTYGDVTQLVKDRLFSVPAFLVGSLQPSPPEGNGIHAESIGAFGPSAQSEVQKQSLGDVMRCSCHGFQAAINMGT